MANQDAKRSPETVVLAFLGGAIGGMIAGIPLAPKRYRKRSGGAGAGGDDGSAAGSPGRASEGRDRGDRLGPLQAGV